MAVASTNFFSEVKQALLTNDNEKVFSLKQTNKEIITPLVLKLKESGEASFKMLAPYSDLYVMFEQQQKICIHTGKMIYCKLKL